MRVSDGEEGPLIPQLNIIFSKKKSFFGKAENVPLDLKCKINLNFVLHIGCS